MDNNLSKEIGIRINTLLAVRNKKQKELAAYLRIQDNTVSYFVSGRRIPNTEQIVKIADYFDVSTDYLLGRSGAKTRDDDLKTVCEYTGLTEEAATALRRQTSEIPPDKAGDEFPEAELQSIDALPKPKYHPEILSRILTSRSFYNMLCLTDEYMHCQEQRGEYFRGLRAKLENGEHVVVGDLRAKDFEQLDLCMFRSQKQYEKAFGELTGEITERAVKSEEELLRLLLEYFKNRIREAEKDLE